MTFLQGVFLFVLGLFVGSWGGIVLMACLVMAGRADDAVGRQLNGPTLDVSVITAEPIDAGAVSGAERERESDETITT